MNDNFNIYSNGSAHEKIQTINGIETIQEYQPKIRINRSNNLILILHDLIKMISKNLGNP